MVAAEPPQPPTAPTAAAATAGAFPEATHRKLSKFALGRQQQRTGGAVAAGPAVAVPPVPLPAAAAASLGEAGSIDAENRQLMAAMTPDQLAEAREEVLQRLPPAAAEFLRQRGAGKAATASGAPAAAAAAGGVAQEAAGPGQQVGAAPSGAGSRSAPSRQPRPQQRQQLGAASSSSPGGGAQASVAERLRFDVDGTVVGVRPADSGSEVAPAEVAQRDLLRQARRCQRCCFS